MFSAYNVFFIVVRRSPSQIRTVLSKLPLTTRLPSPENDTELTKPAGRSSGGNCRTAEPCKGRVRCGSDTPLDLERRLLRPRSARGNHCAAERSSGGNCRTAEPCKGRIGCGSDTPLDFERRLLRPRNALRGAIRALCESSPVHARSFPRRGDLLSSGLRPPKLCNEEFRVDEPFTHVDLLSVVDGVGVCTRAIRLACGALVVTAGDDRPVHRPPGHVHHRARVGRYLGRNNTAAPDLSRGLFGRSLGIPAGFRATLQPESAASTTARSGWVIFVTVSGSWYEPAVVCF